MIEHLPDLEEALKRFKDPIILGNLNVDLEKARIPWSQRVAELLAEYGLIDLVRHFRQCRRLRNLKTWSQVCQGIVLFKLVGIRDMQNFSSDQFALWARLLRPPTF